MTSEFLRPPMPPFSWSAGNNTGFSSPGASTPGKHFLHNYSWNASTIASSASSFSFAPARSRFRSRRVRKDDIARPWMDEKDPRRIWHLVLPLIGVFLGFAITGYYIYHGMQNAPQHEFCMVLNEDFSSGILDTKIWTQEVELGGFGNGQFEQTTADGENAYVKDGLLWIQPTLQNETLLATNTTLNLFNNGCTGTTWSDCVAVTNTTNGTIINPVKSARLSTRNSASIQYGRVEVRARLASGDWLWPAIWMLPVESKYGVWPASGEIDIVESRGNNYTYPKGGNNVAISSTHWGPDSSLDQGYRTNSGNPQLHDTYPDSFHTFGLEWTPDYLYTYIDSRVRQVLRLNFNKDLFTQGDFPAAWPNGSQVLNPWLHGTSSAPFDQEFYLILNVAVGGTNGWFADGVAGKPWTDGSSNAAATFWGDKPSWYPTWQKEGAGVMQVESVKMWQLSGFRGCK